MAKLIAIGAAQAISQVDTVTMTGTFAATETVTIKVDAASVTYTCGGSETVSTVAAALLALCQASSDARFKEITWTAAAGVVTATSTPGVPVTITASDTAASGAATKASVSAATGPHHWDNAENWSTGAVPTTADEVFIQDSAIALRYGLPTSLTLGKFVHDRGELGLPERSASGYDEYRPTRAVFTCLDCTFGTGPDVGPALSRVDLASGASIVAVYGSKSRRDSSAIDILCNNAAAEINAIAGQVSIAAAGDETSQAATIRIGAQASAIIGNGVTVASIYSSGNTQVNCPATTLTVDGGTTTTLGSEVVTNFLVRGGTLIHKSDGTVTAATVGPGRIDLSRDMRTKTITTLTLKKDGSYLDPYNIGTLTNFVLDPSADLLTAS